MDVIINVAQRCSGSDDARKKGDESSAAAKQGTKAIALEAAAAALDALTATADGNAAQAVQGRRDKLAELMATNGCAPAQAAESKEGWLA